MATESKIPVEEVMGDGGWGETRQDVHDMARLGKKQEFKVNSSIDGEPRWQRR